MKPSVAAIQLAALTIDTMLYSCFLTLCAVAAAITIQRHKRAGQPSTLFVYLWSPSILATFGLLVSITGHWIALVYRAFQAFILYNDGRTPITFYNDLTQYSERLTNGFLNATFLIWDSVLIYRLWMVWDRSFWVIVLPCCMYLGSAITGIRTVYMLSKTGNGLTFFYSEVAPWLTSYAVLMFLTNVYCTVLITFRIWYHDRKMRRLFSRLSSTGILGIFVESALVYAIWNIIYLFVYVFHSPMEFFILNTWVPLAGVSYILILIRVGLGYGYQPTNDRSDTPGTLTALTQLSLATGGEFQLHESMKDDPRMR